MEAPSSPGTEAVELRDFLEELLKFTLQSHVSQTLGLDFDLGLSTDYCSALLEVDGNDLNSSSSPSYGKKNFIIGSPFQLFVFRLSPTGI